MVFAGEFLLLFWGGFFFFCSFKYRDQRRSHQEIISPEPSNSPTQLRTANKKTKTSGLNKVHAHQPNEPWS